MAERGMVKIDSNLLEQSIARRGIKKKHLAEVIGLTPKALHFKSKGLTQFLPTEITVVANELGLTRDEIFAIFFPQL